MRPTILQPLFAPLNRLPGVGDRIAPLIEKVSGPLIRDLVFTPPGQVIARTPTREIASLPDGTIATVPVVVEAHLPPEQPRRPYRVRTRAADAFLTLVWFHARAPQMRKLLPEGEKRIVSGKLERFGGEIQILHPDHVVPPERASSIPRLEPVYPLTMNLSNRVMGKAVMAGLQLCPELDEWQRDDMLARHAWPDWRGAIRTLHFQTDCDREKARQRLAYDELLADQVTLTIARNRTRARKSASLEKGRTELLEAVRKAAPFAPTGAQRRAVNDIIQDLEAPLQMSRLLQGDVGSGKTFVAALVAARLAAEGYQSAIMAPTEVLARQHAETLRALLQPAGITVIALTGRDKGKARQRLLNEIADGTATVICGTQALFQDDVAFHRLRLVIVDEQHRFGVQERMRLLQKAEQPDLLVMTATPIPRTLTLARYADMSVSLLDEKPAGRKPIDTLAVPDTRLNEVSAAVGRALERGEQVYWVCPLVEESEELDLTSVEQRHGALVEQLPGARAGLLHGRLKGEEKDALVEQFKTGALNLLVATTVIEVGIDAPDATLIVIENAERFGLSQLHQLRGRVGRGDRPSRCILLYKTPIGATATERLKVIRESQDGFYLAEQDWKLRGAGDVLGHRQTGDIRYRFADLDRDGDLLAAAAKDARLLLEEDPGLNSARGQAIRTLLYLFSRDRAISLLRVG